MLYVLDLRKTSSESGVARRDVKFHFSDGKVSIDTLTAENEILRSAGTPELAGILRKSSVAKMSKISASVT